MKKAARVFLILGIVFGFPAILPIIFGIITLRKLDDVKTKEELKLWGILSIIFVSILGGVFTLCVTDDDLIENPVSRTHKRFNFRGSLCMPYGVFMALFVIFPLVLILYYAFIDDAGHFTFNNWGSVFTTVENWKVIGNTFIISISTTLLCLIIAYPIAFILSNSKLNKNKVLVYIFLLPMWVNFVIRTLALKALVNNFIKAIFGVVLTSKYPMIAIIVGMVYDYLPFAILPLYNQMLKMDKNQIEAAADLGANPVQVFVKTIIPMTVPGIVSAATMTFMPTMSSYVIANQMSERTMQIVGNLIQHQFELTHYNIGSVLSIVMLMIIGLSLLVEKAIDRKSDGKKGGIW